MELALHSGAEYYVFLLVHVKDDELPIFSDSKTMNDLQKWVPPVFRKLLCSSTISCWRCGIPKSQITGKSPGQKEEIMDHRLTLLGLFYNITSRCTSFPSCTQAFTTIGNSRWARIHHARATRGLGLASEMNRCFRVTVPRTESRPHSSPDLCRRALDTGRACADLQSWITG